MVGAGRNLELVRQQLDQRITSLASRGINDARACGPLQELFDLFVFFTIALPLHDSEVQIGARKTTHELFGTLQTEDFYNVLANAGSGGGRQGDRLHTTQPFAELADAGIVRAKVVPPLADAVGFVDSQQLNGSGANGLHKAVVAEPFGGDVHQLVLAGCHVLETLLLLPRR